MFKQSLSTLKKRTTELGSQLSKGFNEQLFKDDQSAAKKAATVFDDFDGLDAFACEDDPTSVSGPILVRYVVQNGNAAERDLCAFVLTLGDRLPTVGIIRQDFPLPGTYHFRFRAPSPDNAFGGMIWADLDNDELVPCFKAIVTMKVLRLPDDAPHRLPISCAASRSGGQSGVARQESALGFVTPSGCPPAVVVEGRKAPARVAAASGGASPLTLRGVDLMEMDLGVGGSASSAPGRSPSPSSSEPSSPTVSLPSREELVANRLREQQERIEAAAAANSAAAERDAQNRAGKLEASNRLSEEMDLWARTDSKTWKDIRTLLGTMHEVMWRDSGWVRVSLADLLPQGSIKKYYRKAIIITHPDRHQDGDPEHQYRSERIFQALNESFKLAEDV